MAYGDPMILTTQDLLENGPLEIWSNTAVPANGWNNWTGTTGLMPTFSRQAGTRTLGAGAYFQRCTCTTPVGGRLEYYQRLSLLGSGALPARGHLAVTFTLKFWARQSSGTATITVQPTIIERNDVTELALSRATAQTLTGSWTQYSHSRALSESGTTELELTTYFICTVVGNGNATIDIDDFELTVTYTFVRNPAIPDDQTIIVPFRKMLRSLGGSLLRARPGVPALAKHEKRLVFAMVARTQYEKFRSLWFLDSPLVWTPNHPHLPTTLIVRWTNDFDFRLLRTLSPEFYQGNMMLTEV